MLNQIKNARVYLQAKLGQRGAEMVEYAIVLACIAAVGVAFYAYEGGGTAENSLKTTFGEKLVLQQVTLTNLFSFLLTQCLCTVLRVIDCCAKHSA